MKRFWTDVSVKDGGIELDGRPVRTPGRAPLTLPTSALATAVAEEWRDVSATIDPRAMPLTGLANAAIDRIAGDTTGFAGGLAAYAASDLLCYRADSPDELVARQALAWDPLIDWASRRYDVHFTIATGVMPVDQPDATLERLGAAVASRDAFALAGLSPIVTTTGSLISALALAEDAAGADAIWSAATVDDDWQREQWGEDPTEAEARATRRRDFDAGVRFLQAL